MSVLAATPDMEPFLREIWLDAFPGDSDEDVSSFFAHALRPESCLVWMEDARPVSMVFLLPATLELTDEDSLGGKSLSLKYVYAAATLSAYRGRGIFGRLLTSAHKLMRDIGVDACFLRPAEPGLFHYYTRFGYRSFFQVVTEHITADEFFAGNAGDLNKPLVFTDMVKEGAAQRNTLLAKHPAWVRWPDELVAYASAQARRMNGTLLAGNGGWAFCEPDGDKLWVREWLCCPESEFALRCAVNERFHVHTITRRRPFRSDDNLPGEAFGMICPLTDDAACILDGVENHAPYMGLAFD